MHIHLQGLNNEQHQAAIAPAPQLVIAGAGSGKTETLARRVVHLITERGTSPDRLLCITFTNKAAGEMRERLARYLPAEQVPRWVGTFHAVTARLLIEDPSGIPGVPRGFAILDPNEARKTLMTAAGLEDAKAGAELFEAVSLLRNHLIEKGKPVPQTPAFARFTDAVIQRARRLIPAYRQALVDRSALDMDDLVILPVEAMQRDASVAERWAQRFDELLVDEYQDTNAAQHALVHLLSRATGRVFAVGDDAQSIYGWRGAEVRYIRRFQKDYPSPAPIKLQTNYRSTQAIIFAANVLISRDDNVIPKVLKPSQPDAPAGEPIKIQRSTTPWSEAQGVVQWVQDTRTRHPSCRLRDFAVLGRAGFILQSIHDELRRAQIPAMIVGDKEPEPPKEVLTAVAWLRLAASRSVNDSGIEQWSATADDAFRRCLAFPSRGISGVVFGALRKMAQDSGKSLAEEVCHLPTDNRIPFENALTTARNIHQVILDQKLRASAALHVAAQAAGLSDALGAETPSYPAWQATVRAAELAGSVAAFCDQAALGAAAAEAGEATLPDAVQIMTLHRSKGLEFEHVFIPGLEDGILPNRKAVKDGALDEERRLLYVGITRAKRTLVLSWVEHRGEWTSKPSRFLDELPKAAPKRHSPKPVVEPKKSARPPSQEEVDRLVQEFRARQMRR